MCWGLWEERRAEPPEVRHARLPRELSGMWAGEWKAQLYLEPRGRRVRLQTDGVPSRPRSRRRRRRIVPSRGETAGRVRTATGGDAGTWKNMGTDSVATVTVAVSVGLAPTVDDVSTKGG